MILSNACIINIVLTGHSGDIEKLLIDKSLVGKLSAEIISDACLTDQYIIASYPDKARIDYIYFCKRPLLGEAIKKLEKVSTWEPKIPASRQHPWQQDQRSPQVTRAPLTYQHSSPGGHSDQSHNASPRVSNNSSQGQRSGRRRVQYSDQQMNQDFDSIDLNSDFIRDYTAALNDGGTSNQSNGQQEEGSSANVIHFGVV